MSVFEETEERIIAARHALLYRGFRRLASGKFGLPSYSHIEAWAKGRLVLYLITDRRTGGWNILNSIDPSNDINATWQAVDALLEAQKGKPE